VVGSKQRVTEGWRRVPGEFREGGVEEEFEKWLAKSIEKKSRVGEAGGGKRPRNGVAYGHLHTVLSRGQLCLNHRI
jgi:hypothetical protein